MACQLLLNRGARIGIEGKVKTIGQPAAPEAHRAERPPV